MELANNIWNQALSSIDILTVSLLIASLSIGYIASSHKLWKDGAKYPPFAPGGMREHIQMYSSSQYPWWILDVARQLQNRVFQLSIPIRPMTRVFVVGELKAFRSILTDPLSQKPLVIYEHFRHIGGGATMFTMNGDGWHKKRKAVAPAFSSNHIKRMTKMAMEKTDVWIRDMSMDPAKNSSFDVGKEMTGIVLSAISETAFEYEISADEKDFFGAEIDLALVEFSSKAPINPLRGLFGLFIPGRRRAFVAAQNVKKMMFTIMNAYRNKEEPHHNGTIIQLIMESDAYPTDDEKVAELIGFLIAGHDTTAFSISWILLELSRNPDEQRKLRASLSQLSPDNWSRSEHLKRVIKEGMRLHPVASGGSTRTNGRDIMTSRNECSVNTVGSA